MFKYLALLAACLALPAQAHVIPKPPKTSWSGYHWTHVLGLRPVPIKVGVNLTKDNEWVPRIDKSLRDWEKSGVVKYTYSDPAGGKDCNYAFGSIQICEGDYGATGWVAYTDVKTALTIVVMARIRINDFYFKQAKWNTEANKQSIICQELGNALGLQDVDRNMANKNLGTCLDYSTNPGNAPTNLAPAESDFKVLRSILYP